MAARWQRSTFCSGAGNCVEVAVDLDAVQVRDSKDPRRQPLAFSRPEWRAFVCGVKAGQFDLIS